MFVNLVVQNKEIIVQCIVQFVCNIYLVDYDLLIYVNVDSIIYFLNVQVWRFYLIKFINFFILIVYLSLYSFCFVYFREIKIR